MKTHPKLIPVVLGLLLASLSLATAKDAETSQSTTSQTSEPIPIDSHLYQGFGNYHRTITTDSAAVQKWFDQGIQLLYGFNHDDAIRSFLAAAAIDPSAAMPWWGIAYAHGININDPQMTCVTLPLQEIRIHYLQLHSACHQSNRTQAHQQQRSI